MNVVKKNKLLIVRLWTQEISEFIINIFEILIKSNKNACVASSGVLGTPIAFGYGFAAKYIITKNGTHFGVCQRVQEGIAR